MSRAVPREAMIDKMQYHHLYRPFVFTFSFALPPPFLFPLSFTVEYAIDKYRRLCECDRTRRQSPPTFSAERLHFAGHFHHRPEGSDVRIKKSGPRSNSVDRFTFFSSISLVGIVYIATIAAFLITHGWCFAKVLLYASWQQPEVLSTSVRSPSCRKNSLIKSRRPKCVRQSATPEFAETNVTQTLTTAQYLNLCVTVIKYACHWRNRSSPAACSLSRTQSWSWRLCNSDYLCSLIRSMCLFSASDQKIRNWRHCPLTEKTCSHSMLRNAFHVETILTLTWQMKER